jgi:hypothetical protein
MFRIQCECGKQLSVAYGQIHMQGRCPWCTRTFTIPAPASLTTGKLKCQCGLVLEYDYKDAGSLCQCSQCNVLFKIPGGTAESMSREMDRELELKKTQTKASEDQGESISQGQVLESLGEVHQSIKPTIRAEYESFGFGKLLVGVAVLFFTCVTLSAVWMWAQGKLKIPHVWVSDELGNDTKENEEEPKVANPVPNDAANVQAEKPPPQRVGAKDIRWVNIGEMPPSVSPKPPERIGMPFTPTPLSDSEVQQLTHEIVTAINNNSSKELTGLMDAEMIGNYLFGHAKIASEKRFQLGSEALELYANHSRLSEQRPDAQAFPPIRLEQSSVPLLRVCNNSYQGLRTIDLKMGPTPTRQPSSSVAPQFQRPIDELIEQYDQLRLAIHDKLPIRFRLTNTFGNRSQEWMDEYRFQRTPLNTLLDHPALYFAVITTRNRAGKPVLLDLACVNLDLCLLETTWNAIDEHQGKKSFDCSRPPNQTAKYILAFQESVGEKAVHDIFRANLAFGRFQIAKRDASVVGAFLEESKIPKPDSDDCLDALEDLERLFPNDTHNVMLQYLLSRDAKFTNEASQLFDRLVAMKFNSIAFYDECINHSRASNDVELARKTIDALKTNCIR